MQLANLLTELQSIFPADQAAWVLAGLRGDALVWKAVQDDDFFRQAQSRWGAQGQLWSPANLALLALEWWVNDRIQPGARQRNTFGVGAWGWPAN